MTFSSDPGLLRRGLHGALAISLLSATVPAWASTDVPVWVSLAEHNEAVFESLVRDFNRSQSEVRVRLRTFDTPETLDSALNAAATMESLPALVQLGDSLALDEVAARPYVQPFHTLQQSAPLKGLDWFVSSDNAFIHDPKGRLMAFPYMLQVPVMYYNQEAFRKAGLKPTVPQRTWIDLQAQLVDLANRGSRRCPLVTDLPVSINLENLAAVNKQMYASAENGLKGKTPASFLFDSTFVRHLSLMISWVRSRIMVAPDSNVDAVARFAKGECAVLMSSSDHIGAFNGQRGLDYAVSGLPYYPEVTREPGNPFVGGSALWALKSSKETTAATATFLAWLAQPEQGARWYRETGFLPVTKAAFQKTPASYYDKLGQWHDLVAVYGKPSAATGQGFRIRNYPAIRARFREILDVALEGRQPAVTALSAAAHEGNKLSHGQ